MANGNILEFCTECEKVLFSETEIDADGNRYKAKPRWINYHLYAGNLPEGVRFEMVPKKKVKCPECAHRLKRFEEEEAKRARKAQAEAEAAEYNDNPVNATHPEEVEEDVTRGHALKATVVKEPEAPKRAPDEKVSNSRLDAILDAQEETNRLLNVLIGLMAQEEQ